MKPSPCLHPVRVYNKTLGSYIYVPCGHCAACLVSKGLGRTDRVNREFLQYRHKYFITLTYSDDFLPIAKYDDGIDKFVHSRDCDYNGELYSSSVSLADAVKNEDVAQNISKYGGLPVLSHSDVRNFKKRLRYYLFKNIGSYEKMYLYCVGEYGPLHFRPHYHILLGTNSESVRRFLRKCVCEAWSVRNKNTSVGYSRPIGRVDYQRCLDGQVSNYCAQYTSCTTHLPLVISRSDFRPFCTYGLSSGFIPPAGDRAFADVLRKLYYTSTPTIPVQKPSSTEVVAIPSSNVNLYRLCPWFVGFSRLSCYGRELLFKFFERYLDTGCTANQFGKAFRRYVESFTVLCSAFGKSPVLGDAEDMLLRLFLDDDLDFDKFQRNISRLFSAFRIVLTNSRLLGISPLVFLKWMDTYHSKLKLFQLKQFYEYVIEQIEHPYYPFTLSDVFDMYYNTPDDIRHLGYYLKQFGKRGVYSLMTIPQQCEYTSMMCKIVNDTTKTKKRNDDFQHRGIRKRKWLPIYSRKYNRFISH